MSRHRRRHLALAGVTAAATLASGGVAQGFGTGGKVLVNVGGVNSAAAIVKASQGRLVLVGSTTNADFDFAVTRLLPSGTPDSSFAGDGTVETDLGGFDSASGGAAKGNKVLVAGAVQPTDTFMGAVLQYTAGGTLDNGFSGDGVAVPVLNGGSFFDDVGVQRDGKVVAVGSAGNRLVVVRLKANGKLDPGFSQDGVTRLKLKDHTSGEALAVQHDGRILVSGATAGASMGAKSVPIIARYTSKGGLDKRFGNNGVALIRGKGFSSISDIAATAKGVVYAAGSFHRNRLGESHLAAYSLTPKGSLNRRFSKDGAASTSFGDDSSGTTVAIQADGRVLVGGNIHDPGGDWLLTRFTAKGKLDKSFSTDGSVSTDFGGGTDFMQSVIALGKGRIAAAGGGAAQTAAAVYKRNGSLDG